MAVGPDQILFDVHTHGVNVKTRDIYLHSVYDTVEGDEEPGVEYRQATTFIKNIQVLDQFGHSPILVHLHTIGGCWNNGMAMFNTIQFTKSKVNMLAYAQASSMSGILFQAANKRIMMPDCYFLMHHGWTASPVQHPFASKNEAEYQYGVCKQMLQIFANRAITGSFFKKRKSASSQTAYAFFDKKLKKEVDWYLNSEEAVYYGLADGILGSKEFPDMGSLRK